MSSNSLSIELHRFLNRYIHSVEQLEILSLLAENPGKSWLENDVFKAVQSSHESVTANLRHFANEKFLIFDAAEGYRFSPETSELTQKILGLLKIHRERRVTIIEAIYKTPIDPVLDFADAFKLRKGKP